MTYPNGSNTGHTTHAQAYENLTGRFGANAPCHITEGTHGILEAKQKRVIDSARFATKYHIRQLVQVCLQPH